MPEYTRIVIAGGGITGLVAAWTLQQRVQKMAHVPVQITLLEEQPRLGGKIQTVRFAGTAVDTGAEALLLQQEGRQLLQDLDLTEELIGPAISKTNIWTRGQLRPLPDGLVMGMPTNLFALLRSGMLSPGGILRAGMDLLLPQTRFSTDPTVQEVIGSRLGSEVVAHLVEPLLGGIHAGKADSLSLAAVAPQILTTARTHRTLLLGMRLSARTTRPLHNPRRSAPPLASFLPGLEHLVNRLRDRLEVVDIQPGNRLQAITRDEHGTYHLACEKGTIEAEQVLLTVPAWEAARLLRPLNAQVARDLRTIAHASVMVAHLAYRHSAFGKAQLQGSGFLVPRSEGRLMNACTRVTQKWTRPGASDLLLLRCSAGRLGDERASQMSDRDLVETLHAELTEAIGVKEPPVDTRVTRWERAFPQYQSGHQTRIQQVETMLAEHVPGLVLAGAAYHGVGLASCIKDGIRAASRLQAQINRLPVHRMP